MENRGRPPAVQAGRGLDSGQVTTWTSWHRWTAISLLAHAFLAVAAAFQRALDGGTGILGLIPVTVPELLDSSAAPSSPTPAATGPTARRGHNGDAITSTAPGRPTSDGTPAPTRSRSPGNDSSSLARRRRAVSSGDARVLAAALPSCPEGPPAGAARPAPPPVRHARQDAKMPDRVGNRSPPLVPAISIEPSRPSP